ncbi:hypothetical protein FDC35_03910 [Clostridium botulinum]|nr:hypothetical protein [Clostridium botulinum]
MNREKRELLLNKLMKVEIEKIRKIVKPYSRNKDIFYDDITIEERDLKEEKASGMYEYDKENYVHRIYINSEDIDYYLKYKDKKDYFARYYKRNLVDTIGHELTHAFVNQKFKYLNRKVNGIDRDASPIFLAHLRMFGYLSNHHCAKNFNDSYLDHKTIEIRFENKNSKRYAIFYREIREYLNSIIEFKEEFNNTQKENVINEQTRDFTQIDFCFSARGSGLKKYISNSINTLCKDKRIVKGKGASVTFAIGSAMQDLEDIKRLVYKKINNGIEAKYYHNSLIKCTNVNKETKILKQIEYKNY